MMLRCSDVSFEYGRGGKVLRGIDFSIEPGAVTVILGPNGAGKTTLLRLLLGVLEPGAGSVTLKGRGVHEMDPRELARHVAYVPQRGGTEFSFTVRQVLAFGVGSGSGAGAVEKIASEMGLLPLMNRAANELSEGQRQRVTLARALVQIESSSVAMQEKVLLADEPFSAMDLRQERMARGVVQRLAERGCGVALVVHDLRTAATLATRAILLDDTGGIRSQGSCADVLRKSELEAVFGPLE